METTASLQSGVTECVSEAAPLQSESAQWRDATASLRAAATAHGSEAAPLASLAICTGRSPSSVVMVAVAARADDAVECRAAPAYLSAWSVHDRELPTFA
ncbi:MAG: hypothetical protein K9J06_07305 [Flavobacteriales bacterium]|nr:hypothetical protein [Flavobacteriales bacterium]